MAEQQTKAGIQLILASDDGRFDFEQAHRSAEAEQQQQQQHLSTAATASEKRRFPLTSVESFSTAQLNFPH